MGHDQEEKSKVKKCGQPIILYGTEYLEFIKASNIL